MMSSKKVWRGRPRGATRVSITRLQASRDNVKDLLQAVTARPDATRMNQL